MATVAERRRVIVNMEKFCAKVVSKLVINISNELFRSTMKDTTLAAHSWVPSVGLPFRYRFSKKKIGKRDYRRSLVATMASIQAMGEERVRRYRLQEDKLYIRNNVPYIGALDDGHNRRRIKKFVSKAIDKGIRKSGGNAIMV